MTEYLRRAMGLPPRPCPPCPTPGYATFDRWTCPHCGTRYRTTTICDAVLHRIPVDCRYVWTPVTTPSLDH